MAKENKQKYDVTNEHPDYEKALEQYILIDDAVNGEAYIKDKGEKYLPRPSGMDDRTESGRAAYQSYITRAHFPDFTFKFLAGLSGIAKINPPKFTLPKSLEYLLENCDGEGTPLDTFFFQSVTLSLKNGRQLLFVDVDEKNNRLKLVRYNASELINWGVVDKIDNGRNLDFLTLREQKANSDDIFSHDYVDQYRVLSTTDTLNAGDKREFISATYNEDSEIIDSTIPSLAGRTYNDFPVVIIGSTDLNTYQDQIPLLGVAKCALQMYMKDADLSNSMFLTCNPTLCISGLSSAEEKDTDGFIQVGSNVALTVEDPNGKVYYTKTDSSGLAEVRLAIGTYLKEAQNIGATLLTSTEQKGVESEGALKIKAASASASLATVSQTNGRGFEKILRHMSVWNGGELEDVSVTVDTDYLENMLSTKDVEAALKLYINDVISHETILNKLIQGNVLDDTFDIPKEISEIEKKKKDDFDELIEKTTTTEEKSIETTKNIQDGENLTNGD